MNSDDIKFLALQELGITELPDFENDDDRSVNVINNNYEFIYTLALQSFNWSFGGRFVELEKLSTQSGKYKNTYELPPDYLGLRGVYSNDGQTPLLDYQLENGRIMTNTDKVFIKYNIKPCEESLPAYFVDYLKYKLAADLCQTITGDKDLQTYLFQKQELAYRQARNIEINQQPVMTLDTGTYIGVRF